VVDFLKTWSPLLGDAAADQAAFGRQLRKKEPGKQRRERHLGCSEQARFTSVPFGHVPMLSRLQEVANVIIGAAGNVK
jgi:hypothetical protein